MSRKLPFKLLLLGSALLAAIFWLLSLIVDSLGDADVGAWAILIIAAGWGIAFVALGILSRNSVNFVKKFQIMVGVACLMVAVVTGINIFLPAWESTLWWPIVAIAIVAGLMIGVLATGGRSQFEAHNQRANSQAPAPKTEWEKRQEQQRRND